MNADKWKIFLSLQGFTDIEEPTPPKESGISIDDVRIKLRDHQRVFDFFDETCKKILVVGTGGGQEVVVLREAGKEVKGITVMYKDIKYAKKYYNIDLYLEDMHDMKSFSCGEFDGVYSSHAFEHSLSPLISLFEVRRVLKERGKFLLVVPSETSGFLDGIQHYSCLSEPLWKHLLDLCGFEIEEVSEYRDNLLFRAIRTNKDCPALFFEKQMKNAGLWR